MNGVELNKFIQKWTTHGIEDAGSVISQDYKQFQREYKKILGSIAKTVGMSLHKFSGSHYEFSAVLKDNEHEDYYYVSICDVRYFSSDWYDHILYRTMSHEHDWTGGPNNYSSLLMLGRALKSLKERRHPESQ